MSKPTSYAGTWLVGKLRHMGLSVYQLSRVSGVPRMSLYQITQGRRRLTRSMFELLAPHLDLAPNEAAAARALAAMDKLDKEELVDLLEGLYNILLNEPGWRGTP